MPIGWAEEGRERPRNGNEELARPVYTNRSVTIPDDDESQAIEGWGGINQTIGHINRANMGIDGDGEYDTTI